MISVPPIIKYEGNDKLSGEYKTFALNTYRNIEGTASRGNIPYAIHNTELDDGTTIRYEILHNTGVDVKIGRINIDTSKTIRDIPLYSINVICYKNDTESFFFGHGDKELDPPEPTLVQNLPIIKSQSDYISKNSWISSNKQVLTSYSFYDIRVDGSVAKGKVVNLEDSSKILCGAVYGKLYIYVLRDTEDATDNHNTILVKKKGKPIFKILLPSDVHVLEFYPNPTSFLAFHKPLGIIRKYTLTKGYKIVDDEIDSTVTYVDFIHDIESTPDTRSDQLFEDFYDKKKSLLDSNSNPFSTSINQFYFHQGELAKASIDIIRELPEPTESFNSSAGVYVVPLWDIVRRTELLEARDLKIARLNQWIGFIGGFPNDLAWSTFQLTELGINFGNTRAVSIAQLQDAIALATNSDFSPFEPTLYTGASSTGSTTTPVVITVNYSITTDGASKDFHMIETISDTTTTSSSMTRTQESTGVYPPSVIYADEYFPPVVYSFSKVYDTLTTTDSTTTQAVDWTQKGTLYLKYMPIKIKPTGVEIFSLYATIDSHSTDSVTHVGRTVIRANNPNNNTYSVTDTTNVVDSGTFYINALWRGTEIRLDSETWNDSSTENGVKPLYWMVGRHPKHLELKDITDFNTMEKFKDPVLKPYTPLTPQPDIPHLDTVWICDGHYVVVCLTYGWVTTDSEKSVYNYKYRTYIIDVSTEDIKFTKLEYRVDLDTSDLSKSYPLQLYLKHKQL